MADNLSRQGNDVTLFSFKGQMDPPANVRLVTMGMPMGFLRERVFHMIFPLHVCLNIKYARMLKDYDQIYTGPYPSSWLAYCTKKLFGRKFNYYFYHFNLPGFVPGIAARIYTWLHVSAEKWTLKHADKVITISKFSRESLKGMFDGEIEVEYCRIDRTKFHPGLDGSAVRLKFGLTDEPLVLCVGQLIPSKGMHLLIQAFNQVKVRRREANLLIAGKPLFPGYVEELRKLADPSVHFVPEISEADMPLYYAACDVYATATLWEGFNLPLVEAQACGRPVVAFDTGPHPEVVDDGVTGMLVAPGNVENLADAITRLLGDAGLRKVMGRKGSEMVRDRFYMTEGSQFSE